MSDALFILIAIEIGMRVFPLLDALVELVSHFIAIGIQKCDSKIRKIALKSEEEELKASGNSLPVIGFRAGDDSDSSEKEEDDFDED